MSGEKEQYLVDYLLDRIKNGSYKIGGRIPSEYQLAQKFNVDKGTANRAVAQLVTRGYLKRTRGAGGTILLRKELFPLKKLVYIGVIPSIHSFYARLLKGLEESAYAAGCSLTVLPIGFVKNYQVFSERLAALQPDAVFVGGESPVVKLPDVPVLCLDTMVKHGNGDKTYLINPDNFTAGRILLENIWKHGHRKVLHYSSSSTIAVQRERFSGAKQRAAELGVELKEIEPASLPVGNISAFKRTLPDLIKQYSVIICENDIAAADLIGQCRRIGIEVPRDISVCGYITGREFHHLYEISSIEYDPYGLGVYAISMALRILGGETDLPRSELLPVSFFEGETLTDFRNQPHTQP
ncbi:MAG: substrate-binding domain-containing protein [Lentisphaeria bacterium]|nr:substrate-binding domain-containing protein [Lentisphaeria bacterium]